MLNDIENQIQNTEVVNRILLILETRQLAGKPELTQRNKDLFIDRIFSNTSYRELAETYGISANRCMQINARISRMINVNLRAEGITR